MTFWILAPIMVVAALGILFVRKAVHAALLLAVVMISLAVLYAVLDAPFLFAVQIIVYTGAILMLFLFVVMLVGVDASDSVVETIKGQRVMAIARRPAARPGPRHRAQPDDAGHGRRSRRRQPRTATSRRSPTSSSRATCSPSRRPAPCSSPPPSARWCSRTASAWCPSRRRPTWPPSGSATTPSTACTSVPLPTPGVYARHNAVDTPALLPDGTAAEASVSRVLAARGTVRSAPAMADDVQGMERQLAGERADVTDEEDLT